MWALREFISINILKLIHDHTWRRVRGRNRNTMYNEEWFLNWIGETTDVHENNVRRINYDFGFEETKGHITTQPGYDATGVYQGSRSVETIVVMWRYTLIFFCGGDIRYTDEECKSLTPLRKDGYLIKKILEKVAPANYEDLDATMRKWQKLPKVQEVINHLEASIELRKLNITHFQEEPDPNQTPQEQQESYEKHQRILNCLIQAVKRLKGIQGESHTKMLPKVERRREMIRRYQNLGPFQVITNRPNSGTTETDDAASAGMDMRESDLTAGGQRGTVAAGGNRLGLIRKDSDDVEQAGIDFPRQQRPRAGNDRQVNATDRGDGGNGGGGNVAAGGDGGNGGGGNVAAGGNGGNDGGDTGGDGHYFNPDYPEDDWRRYAPEEIDKGAKKSFSTMTDKEQRICLRELWERRNELSIMNDRLRQQRMTQKTNPKDVKVKDVQQLIAQNADTIKNIEQTLSNYKPDVKNKNECKRFFDKYIPIKTPSKPAQKKKIGGSGVIVEPPDQAQSLIDNLNFLKNEFDKLRERRDHGEINTDLWEFGERECDGCMELLYESYNDDFPNIPHRYH